MSKTVDFSLYDRLTVNRPFKLDAEEVNYREAMDEECCDKCLHFYTRKVDGYAVCEILRDIKNDDEEYPIKLDWVCQFWTSDGDHFPLYDGEIKPTGMTSEADEK